MNRFCPNTKPALLVHLLYLQLCMLVLCAGASYSSPPQPDIYDEDNQAYMQFSVALTDPIDGAFAIDGQEVHCTLKTEATIDDRMVAPIGSTVIAHVNTPRKDNGARAEQKVGRLKLRKALFLHFDKIITPDKKELNISGIPVPQNTIFNNAGSFRQLEAGSKGELVKAEDLDLVDMNEAGIFLPKGFTEKKNFFGVNLKEGDEIKVEAYLAPSANLSGKLLKAGQTKPNPQ
jgi:hypothetical protein